MRTRRIFVRMDIQADIKWIVAELRSVKDPHLIEAFKQLLKYRKSDRATDQLDQALERAMADKAEGRVIPHEEVRKKYDKWL